MTKLRLKKKTENEIVEHKELEMVSDQQSPKPRIESASIKSIKYVRKSRSKKKKKAPINIESKRMK